MRIVFMGTPEFAVPVLDALVAGHEVVAAYTQPPRPGGRRGRELVASPVQRRAEALGIEVRSPPRLREPGEQAAFAALGADVAVVAAYGLILPQPVLDAPRQGCLNVHASLLPRWRGAAPIQRAILAGDEETGVCIMLMEAGLDTGPVLLAEATPIGEHDTAGVLTHRLALIGGAAMARVLGGLADHAAVAQPDEGVTYAAKIAKSEAKLDWSLGAVAVHRQVRAFNPAPGAWFGYAGERIKVLTADIVTARGSFADTSFEASPGEVLDADLTIGCGKGAIRPRLVQRAGRGVTDAVDMLRGFPIPAGTRLT